MKNAFVSWSGGKDCCQAAYLSTLQGFQLKYLFNMINRDVERSCSHGISTRWIKLQAEAMGVPLIQQTTSGQDYESVFIAAIQKLKTTGVTHGVFGDIDFEPHREWIEKVCQAAGIVQVLPLWQGDQNRIARDFIQQGFKSVVIATRADLLGEEWLGRNFDTDFLEEIAALNSGITPCGEAGEFHTLVIDGPLFQKRMEIREAVRIRRQDHWFLDIKQIELIDKS